MKDWLIIHFPSSIIRLALGCRFNKIDLTRLSPTHGPAFWSCQYLSWEWFGLQVYMFVVLCIQFWQGSGIQSMWECTRLSSSVIFSVKSREGGLSSLAVLFFNMFPGFNHHCLSVGWILISAKSLHLGRPALPCITSRLRSLPLI